ncbi:MAG: histidine phosphatase family protein, partial [Burkholderiales bacterium]|nr:histidine phosphatase family protein [Burkholderiales bacterium]
ALRLRGRWPDDVPVFSSPLQRCQRLARYFQPSPEIDARLAELDFGNWEMQRWDDIPRAEIDAWAADTVHYRPGGGENVLAMAERIIQFVATLRQRRIHHAVLVCHAGSMRLLHCYQNGNTAVELAQQVCIVRQHFEFGTCSEVSLFV